MASVESSDPGKAKSRWFFSKDVVINTPSVKAGLPVAKEVSYRQQAANFIQDMGQHLRV
jgi:cyclin T